MIYAIAAVLVLVLDQAVKFWTTRSIPLDAIGDQCVGLIPNVVHMTNVHNTGAAFSILENARWVLIGVSVVFVIGIIVLISLEIIHTRFGKWTAVLVMAGALGNCIDRILYGYVVDMFEIELFTFAVFNVADIFITVCGILFCIHVIVYKDPDAVRVEDRNWDETDEAAEKPAKRTRKTKEDPYAAIPHRDRADHRSLDEELRPADPDDPFGEWSFGDVVEEPAPKRARKAAPSAEEEPTGRRVRKAAEPAAEEEPAPRRTRKTAAPVNDITDENDDWLDLDKIASNRGARKETTSRQTAPSPEKTSRRSAPVLSFDEPNITAPKAETQPAEEESFTLEDILSEFKDIDF